MPKDDRKWFLVDIDCYKHMRVAIKTDTKEQAEQDASKLVQLERIDLTEAADYAYGTNKITVQATQLDQRPPKRMLKFREVACDRLERMQ
jgi:hypothetical protein